MYIKQRVRIAYSCSGGGKVTYCQLRKFRLIKRKFFCVFFFKKNKTRKSRTKESWKGLDPTPVGNSAAIAHGSSLYSCRHMLHAHGSTKTPEDFWGEPGRALTYFKINGLANVLVRGGRKTRRHSSPRRS